jgi:hypothetical protein
VRQNLPFSSRTDLLIGFNVFCNLLQNVRRSIVKDSQSISKFDNERMCPSDQDFNVVKVSVRVFA